MQKNLTVFEGGFLSIRFSSDDGLPL